MASFLWEQFFGCSEPNCVADPCCGDRDALEPHELDEALSTLQWDEESVGVDVEGENFHVYEPAVVEAMSRGHRRENLMTLADDGRADCSHHGLRDMDAARWKNAPPRVFSASPTTHSPRSVSASRGSPCHALGVRAADFGALDAGPYRGRAPVVSVEDVVDASAITTHAGTSASSCPGPLRRAAVSASSSVNPLSSFGFMTLTVPACDYKGDASDAMDMEVYRHLARLPREAAMAFPLRRLATGRYEIDGRIVTLRWDMHAHGKELFAQEDEAPGLAGIAAIATEAVPLMQYLNEISSIAVRVRQPLRPRTLTFVGQENRGTEDRFHSMQVACKQAYLREQAAGACHRR